MNCYICRTCGNIIEVIEPSGVTPVCCGKSMEKLHASCNDSEHMEKHVPVVVVETNGDVIVKVGSITHPMSREHCIKWIAIKTDQGVYRKMLKPDHEPKACFKLCGNEKFLKAYAYCNIHGLWISSC